MQKILVTGGAGYIGSHTHWQLIEAGYDVVVVDNFYSGHRWAIHPKAFLIEGDAGDELLMRRVLTEHKVDAVIHFAGHIVVPESVVEPLKYYANNTCVSQRLIAACIAASVGSFVYSSSAAVYGAPKDVPVKETAPTLPINPYGTSKLMVEQILQDVSKSKNRSTDGNKEFRFIALRYFNVAGARLDGKLGQATPEATHLIKIACQAACGLRDHVDIFGTDYDTPDGTCVRDYIHVEDLASVHIMALRYLKEGGSSQILNCGYGKGFSVREVLETLREVSGSNFRTRDQDRRAGDSPILVSDPRLLKKLFGWKPRFAELPLICESAYRWERAFLDRTMAVHPK